MPAILLLARKYADRIASCAADVAASAVGDIAEEVSESFCKEDWGTSSEYPPAIPSAIGRVQR
jgi:hypothetical protein